MSGRSRFVPSERYSELWSGWERNPSVTSNFMDFLEPSGTVISFVTWFEMTLIFLKFHVDLKAKQKLTTQKLFFNKTPRNFVDFVATLPRNISFFSLKFHFSFKSQYVKWKNDFTSLFTIVLLANGYSFAQSCDKSVKSKPLEKSPARFSLLLFSRWLNLLFPSWKFKGFGCLFCASNSAWCAKTICVCR